LGEHGDSQRAVLIVGLGLSTNDDATHGSIPVDRAVHVGLCTFGQVALPPAAGPRAFDPAGIKGPFCR